MNPSGAEGHPPAHPEAVRWLPDRPGISLLDQTRLPTAEVRVELETADEVADAIHGLRVRGAPAIGVTAAMGLAASMTRWLAIRPEASGAEASARLDQELNLILASRPTARNLGHELERMRASFEAGPRSADPARVSWATHPVAAGLVGEAERIRQEDVARCAAIGRAGADLAPEEGIRLLTHCNTGALATAGSGTALAVVYELFGRGVPVEVWACEARPVLQGARLTAWELERAGVPVTLIPDSAAGALMAEGRVDAVIVGADAICANGDVVNKIGTYGLAVLAAEHGLPFYVAAPRTTVTLDLASGADVPIEERSADEVRRIRGHPVAPTDIPVWNPAFDRTPAHLVTALITDGGVLRPPYGPALARLVEVDSSRHDD